LATKRLIRPEATARALGISVALLYEGLAKGTINLRRVQIGERAVGFDEDDVLLLQLNKLADRDGLTGFDRETWIDQEFIKQKAITERVHEYRQRTEGGHRPRGMHGVKQLAEAATT